MYENRVLCNLKFYWEFQVEILNGKLAAGRGVLKTPAAKQRAGRHLRDNRVSLYRQIGVKALVKEDGRVAWFGCKKETQVGPCFVKRDLSIFTTINALFYLEN